MKHVKSFSSRWVALPLVAGALLLTACGGGGDTVADQSPPPSGPQPEAPIQQAPGSASSSTEGLLAYLKGLTNALSSDASPVGVDAFAPPKPNDTEPEPLG